VRHLGEYKVRARLRIATTIGELFVPDAHLQRQAAHNAADGRVMAGNQALHAAEQSCVDITPHFVRMALEALKTACNGSSKVIKFVFNKY